MVLAEINVPEVHEFIAAMWGYGFVFGLGWFVLWGALLGMLNFLEEL